MLSKRYIADISKKLHKRYFYGHGMSKSTLVLIHAIARHGDKTTDPSVGYPNDPYKDHKYYPYGYGMLTNEGKRTMYSIGKAFRETYDDFLGETYLPQHLETWTTGIPRTQASAQLLLAAIFPPKGDLKWNEELNWQPIHTNYNPLHADDLLMIITREYMKKCSDVWNSDYGKEIFQKYQDIIPYIEKHSGLKLQSIGQLWALRDCLEAQEGFGLALPEWTKSIYPEKLLAPSFDNIRMNNHTKELRKIACGNLLKKILSDTKKKIDKASESKMHLYVGHDFSIANMLVTLGLYYDHVPKYGASIVFEVHKLENKYGIKIFYKKDKNAMFEAMIPNAGPIWWIEDFEKFVEDLCE